MSWYIGFGKKLLQFQFRSGGPRVVQYRSLRLQGVKDALCGQRPGLLLLLAVPSGLAAYHSLRPSCVAALCKQKQPLVPIQRLTATASTEIQPPFNWALFLQFVLPDAVLLLIAVGVSSLVPACDSVVWDLRLGLGLGVGVTDAR